MLSNRSRPVAVGISGHNGWAVCVAVAARDGAPVVVDRRRVELLEPGLPNQPYHHETLRLDTARAEELVKEVRTSALRSAGRALAELQSSLREIGDVVMIASRQGPLPSLPEPVAAVHASYPVLVRADAMIYHEALCKAASSLGVPVELIRRGDEYRHASEALQVEAAQLASWLANLRGSLGPPWQRDHREAVARAVTALAKYTGLRLPDTGPTPHRRQS